MNCLIDYILLDGVASTVTPNSGLYVNRELTIPLANINGVINTDPAATLESLWEEIQVKAIRKFVIRIKLGMQEMYSNCTVVDDVWVCANRELLALPLLYFLGSELMLEVKHTNRINRYTTIDRSRAGDMKAEFDAEFQVQLKAALEMINAKNNTNNGRLGEIFTYVEVLP